MPPSRLQQAFDELHFGPSKTLNLRDLLPTADQATTRAESWLRERQDAITAARHDDLVGSEVDVLVDAPGEARSHREAPEIDGIVVVPDDLEVGGFHRVRITGAEGPDTRAEPLVLVGR